MAAMASAGGMIPEQVWDAAPLAARGLSPGRPTGVGDAAGVGARGIPEARCEPRPGASFNLRPEAVWQPLRRQPVRARRGAMVGTRTRSRVARRPALWLCLDRPGPGPHGIDGWQASADSDTAGNGLGQHVVALPTSPLEVGARSRLFHLFLADGGGWEGQDHRIDVG